MVGLVGYTTVKESVEFNKLYKSSQAKHSAEFVLFYNPKYQNKVAFVAGKKVGNAVKRNRAKRLLRALFIAHSPNLKGGSYIFVAKPKILQTDFAQLDQRFITALTQLNAAQTKL
ncbi:MAG: ribonuclease P protein component [Campylobacterota bacterium]